MSLNKSHLHLDTNQVVAELSESLDSKQISHDSSKFAEEEIKDRVQNRDRRLKVEQNIFWTLWGELIILLILLLLQGFHLGGFELNQWSFGFFINGCLIQTFFIVRFVVGYLFPQSNFKK